MNQVTYEAYCNDCGGRAVFALEGGDRTGEGAYCPDCGDSALCSVALMTSIITVGELIEERDTLRANALKLAKSLEAMGAWDVQRGLGGTIGILYPRQESIGRAYLECARWIREDILGEEVG